MKENKYKALLSPKEIELLGQAYEDGDHSYTLNEYILRAQIDRVLESSQGK